MNTPAACVSRSLGQCRVSFSCCAKFAIQKRFASTSKIVQPASPRRQASLGLLAVGTLAFGAFGYYWKIRLSSESNSRLSYATFTPLAIRSVEQVTSDSSIITLDLPVDRLPDSSTYPEPPNTPLQAIYIRQPELQIQRAYTPLDAECFSQTDKNEKGPRRIRLLVKRYNDGEVSSYLHRLRTGDQVYVRGPVRTWTVPDCDHLIFVSNTSHSCLPTC